MIWEEERGGQMDLDLDLDRGKEESEEDREIKGEH